jgi:hypothetical protein
MKPKLSDAPLSSASLRKDPPRFERVLGMSVENFDQVLKRVTQLRLEALLSARICWEAERVVRLHERTSEDLAEQLCITLLYQRQYMTQEVIGASFGIKQGSVSNIIKRIEPLVLKALPTPEAVSHRIAECIEVMPAQTVENFQMVVIGDGAEQPCQRPGNADEQKARYSGKKKTPYHQNPSPRNAKRLDS